jgi:hypothetical protein
MTTETALVKPSNTDEIVEEGDRLIVSNTEDGRPKKERRYRLIVSNTDEVDADDDGDCIGKAVRKTSCRYRIQ